MTRRIQGPTDKQGRPLSYRQIFEELYFERLTEKGRKGPLPTYVKLLLVVAMGVGCFVCSVPVLILVARIFR